MEFSPELSQSIASKIKDLQQTAAFSQLSLSDEQTGQLQRLFLCSDFAMNTCQRFPEYAAGLASTDIADAEKQLVAYVGELSEIFTAIESDADAATKIRNYRNCEMLRIVWRDAVLNAPVTETLHELSFLADACITVGMRYIYEQAIEKHGEPLDKAGNRIYPVVFAMGKLGAYELNFSSDIDLIFTYAEDGEIVGERKSMTYNEFFTRVCQGFIKLLSENSAWGFVFRVDARLRPFGDSGRLAISFDAMEIYYEQHGREWERYAFIKARAISEDEQAAREIADRLRPFVFRRYLDFSAFASLREMKRLIDQEQKRKGYEGNVKLGPGGIREIEFIGQAYQLIRGGRDKRLQARGILQVLQILHEQKLLPDYVYEALKAAYLFLRKTENAIQYFADKQTHMLPTDSQMQQRLAFALNFQNWDALKLQLQDTMQTVHEHFEQIFSAPQLEAFDSASGENEFNALWLGTLSDDDAMELLYNHGFHDAKEALRRITTFRNG
ncbi:MAG: bifunctional [glutamate--ammonia ligase]-adenylyl-L-tyrosine phosphorylase/[glutamate--ammonia-ligase] adenylyltransferase, partial [Gammaproteobacteria bacterium]|nr:bifunctional [glutamate--ammonia ligase]-adenylyl-L-tyrosine phosphorylase/[glutamate--ammonia-ligase] adenylyltransferase [Gammaproteobacteria bacterium]